MYLFNLSNLRICLIYRMIFNLLIINSLHYFIIFHLILKINSLIIKIIKKIYFTIKIFNFAVKIFYYVKIQHFIISITLFNL